MWKHVYMLLLFGSVTAVKRLVLHSDEDIASEIIQLKADVATLKNSVQNLETENSKLVSAGKGSVYVRWGRSECPANGTDLVYRGYAGGNAYDHPGGSAEYICLPEHPTWAKYHDGVYRWRGYVYGTEYETPLDSFTIFGYATQSHDVPCAVCKTERKITLMIPARSNCYPGWTMEYTGYLMSAYWNYPSNSDYACVDAKPDFVPHGEANMNGHLMYFVESRCGSLACPPYVDGRELACVVCSI